MKINCPICGKERNITGLPSHFTEHKIKLLDWSMLNSKNYNWYENYKIKSKEVRKQNSPFCIEFYNKRFPNLTQEEREKMLLEKQNQANKNAYNNIKIKEQKLKDELGENYEKYKKQKYKEKGLKDKETEIKRLMFENGISYEEAAERFRYRRVIASPRTVDYWLEKGFTLDEANIKVSEWQSEQSLRCKESWIKKGFDEETAIQKVKELQSSYTTKSPVTKKYWENIDSVSEELKEKMRRLYVKKYNNVFETLKEEGYVNFSLTDELFNKILEDEAKIEKFSEMFNFRNLNKKKYYKMVWFFTELNISLIKDSHLRSREYHIDHIYSIIEGFKNNISPEIIGSVVNLRILERSENCSKKEKCDLTKDKLLEKYEKYIKKN